MDRLLPTIIDCGQDAQGVEVMELLECVAVDFVTGYIFGSDLGTDFLGEEIGQAAYLDEWARIRKSSGSTGKPVTESLPGETQSCNILV